MDGWMDEQISKRMTDELIQMDGWMNKQTNEQTNKQKS